jgi:hypothetical protein
LALSKKLPFRILTLFLHVSSEHLHLLLFMSWHH